MKRTNLISLGASVALVLIAYLLALYDRTFHVYGCSDSLNVCGLALAGWGFPFVLVASTLFGVILAPEKRVRQAATSFAIALGVILVFLLIMTGIPNYHIFLW